MMISNINNGSRTKKSKYDFRIVIVGPSKAGKSTMLRFLIDKADARVMQPTYGYQLEKIHYRGIQYLIYDLGGQQAFVHSFWKKNVEAADAVIFVVDTADPESIKISKEYLMSIASWIKQSIPLMILGNKRDLPSSVSKEELLQQLELGEILLSVSNPVSAFQLFDTSAKHGTGVHKAFDWLAQRLGKVLPGTSEISIHKVLVFNNSGIPVTESRRKIEKDLKYLEWIQNTPKETSSDSIDNKAIYFSGIINAIDMMSSFLGGSLKSITLESKGDRNFIMVKEEREDKSCVILCNEGDDLSLIRDLGQRILEWITKEKKARSQLKSIGVQRFSEKVEELVDDLYTVSPRKRKTEN